MTNRDNSAHLTRIVENAIQEHGFSRFAQYWKLYRDTADISTVQRFFVRTESDSFYPGGYCNVAVIGDGLLVDIEGDDRQSKGGLAIQSLDSITKVSIHAGSLPGLRNSQNATLIVIARRAEDTEVGPHWIATNEEEEGHLLQFAHTLVRVVSQP